MNLNTSIPFAKGDVFDLPECVAFPEFSFVPRSVDYKNDVNFFWNYFETIFLKLFWNYFWNFFLLLFEKFLKLFFLKLFYLFFWNFLFTLFEIFFETFLWNFFLTFYFGTLFWNSFQLFFENPTSYEIKFYSLIKYIYQQNPIPTKVTSAATASKIIDPI